MVTEDPPVTGGRSNGLATLGAGESTTRTVLVILVAPPLLAAAAADDARSVCRPPATEMIQGSTLLLSMLFPYTFPTTERVLTLKLVDAIQRDASVQV